MFIDVPQAQRRWRERDLENGTHGAAVENSPGGNSPEGPRAPNPFSGELLPRGRCRTGWWKSNSSGKHKIPPLTEQPHGLELTFVMSVSAPGMPEIPGQSRARAHHGERKWQIPFLLLQIQGHKNSITVPWSVRETVSSREKSLIPWNRATGTR